MGIATKCCSVLVMAVILVIIALDSPQQSFIRLSQASLIQLRDSLQAESHHDSAPTACANSAKGHAVTG